MRAVRELAMALALNLPEARAGSDSSGEQRPARNHRHGKTLRVDEIAWFLSRLVVVRESVLLSPRGRNLPIQN